MHTFKDCKDRAWTVTIDYAAIKRVRGRLSLDLLKLVEDRMEPLVALMRDPIAFIDLIYVLCEAQCKEKDVSDEDFGRAMAGDALAEAADAFIGALTDFFPSRQRHALTAALEKGKQVGQILYTRGLTAIADADPESVVTKIIDQAKKKHSMQPASTP